VTDRVPGETTGSLAVRVTRAEPDVALIETSSPSHREYFFVAAGQNSLIITVVDAGEKSSPEPRVHVVTKPYGWHMRPEHDPPTAADDHDLLVKVWQVVGAG
jgi:hypothetical protein